MSASNLIDTGSILNHYLKIKQAWDNLVTLSTYPCSRQPFANTHVYSLLPLELTTEYYIPHHIPCSSAELSGANVNVKKFFTTNLVNLFVSIGSIWSQLFPTEPKLNHACFERAFSFLSKCEVRQFSIVGFVMEGKTALLNKEEKSGDHSIAYWMKRYRHGDFSDATVIKVMESDHMWRVKSVFGKSILEMHEAAHLIKFLWFYSYVQDVLQKVFENPTQRRFLIVSDRSALCHDIFDFLWLSPEKQNPNDAMNFHSFFMKWCMLAFENKFEQIYLSLSSSKDFPNGIECFPGREFEAIVYNPIEKYYTYRRLYYTYRDMLLNGSAPPVYYTYRDMRLNGSVPPVLLKLKHYEGELQMNHVFDICHFKNSASPFLYSEVRSCDLSREINNEYIPFSTFQRNRDKFNSSLEEVANHFQQKFFYYAEKYPEYFEEPFIRINPDRESFRRIVMCAADGFICQGKSTYLRQLEERMPKCETSIFIAEGDERWRANNNLILEKDQESIFYFFLYDINKALYKANVINKDATIFTDRGIFGHVTFQNQISLFFEFQLFMCLWTKDFTYAEKFFENIFWESLLSDPKRAFEREANGFDPDVVDVMGIIQNSRMLFNQKFNLFKQECQLMLHQPLTFSPRRSLKTLNSRYSKEYLQQQIRSKEQEIESSG